MSQNGKSLGSRSILHHADSPRTGLSPIGGEPGERGPIHYHPVRGPCLIEVSRSWPAEAQERVWSAHTWKAVCPRCARDERQCFTVKRGAVDTAELLPI